MNSSVMKSLVGVAVVTSVALSACGGRTSDLGDAGTSSSSGGGSGGAFPYSGPSCGSTTIPQACWSCIENSCPSLGACLASTCSAYFDCYCACNPGDSGCLAGCQSAISPACDSCIASSEQCLTNSCTQPCTTSTTGGGGTGTSSSGGTSTVSQCTGSTTCNSGQTLQICATLEDGACTGAYYQIAAQTFQCASCTDTTACQQHAMAACQ